MRLQFLHLLSWLNAQIQYEQMLIKFWLWVNYINLLISEILWLIDFKTCKRNKCIPTKMFFFAASPLVTPSYCNIFHEWLWMWLMWENLCLHHLHQSVVGGNCLYSSVDHAIGLAVIKISISFFEIIFWWVSCQSAKFFSKGSDKILWFVWEAKD